MMRTACFLMVAMATASVPLVAQTPDTLDLRAALGDVRAGRSADRVVAILTQRDGPRSPRELDAVADSLVVIAKERGDPDGPLADLLFGCAPTAWIDDGVTAHERLIHALQALRG